ncbi:lytic transglycosylase domain-containing protein [Bradyrhizobium sp. LCT2]|uniref:lytic transglycosylase domain-containing protein n=1 Tax=Bradyrhizobium sp. LCT2 TaxID=2493093 RepID=UPI0013743077|nr:lytic transglycosylase domain-containing protein [Bradyrhizobium sp. LCT2]
MQDPVARAGNEAHQRSTSLFGGKPSHPFVPLERQSASVQTSGRGRGRPPRIPLPDESMTGCSRHGRDAVRLAILLITVLLTIGGTMPAVSAERAPARGQPARDRYVTYVAEAALRFGIPTAWIRAVMRVESNGDRRAVSPKGALGLMQLMPKTWADMRARYGLGRDPFDPHDNILAGAAFLRELHDRYGSPGFLAAYNAGPGRYEDFRDRHRPLPAETTAYVAAIVPFVDAERTPGPFLVAAPSRSSWTQASLFFGHVDGPSSAAPAAFDRPTHDKPAVAPVHDLSAIAPQSEGLFVALSTAGRPQ